MNSGKKIIYFLAFAVINQALSFSIMLPQAIYYLIMAIGLVFVLNKNPKVFNFPLLFFICIAIISLLVNDVPAIFKSNERLLIFVLVLAFIGPLIVSKKIFVFRNQIFILINKMLIAFSALSFITYLLGISFPRSGTGSNSGLFVHSLMLGPLASISLLLLMYVKVEYKSFNFKMKYSKYLNVIIVLVTMSILISSSRSSIIGTIFGGGFFLFKINQNRISKFLSSIFKIVLLLLITSPLWFSFTEGIRKKMDAAEANNDLASSRSAHWEARFYEFNSSPLFGIGFASADIYSPIAIGINTENGGLEPGSSWMAILAMTGILGFLTIAFLFITLFFFLWNEKNSLPKSGILGALLVFFTCHMIAEGYILAAGSFLFFYLWMLLGIIYGYKIYKDVKII